MTKTNNSSQEENDSVQPQEENKNALPQPLPTKLSSPDQKNSPIVGIGASAGGLKSFESFFTNMPPDSDMAFILVQHLDPHRESMLVELLQRYTRMEVVQVQDGQLVQPNHIYIIPPNRDMSLMHGSLYLMQPAEPRGLRLPIDSFLRSLAKDQGERSICIILSGTGTDGTLGLKAIKEAGGLTVVQSPSSSAYDGMPQSAINTGLVDYVLAPSEMPEQLLNYVQNMFQASQDKISLPKASAAMQKIFILLRNQTGHDFSHYKQNTISRRIERRMTVNQIKHIEQYIAYLQKNSLEIDTLFKELLIGVTSFFRDQEAFAILEEKIIPQLFQDRSTNHPVRIWVTGCSTGEEAYSIAILVQEHLNKLDQYYKVQIFATDVDAEAIEKGRQATYPDNIAADIISERLHRFFDRLDNAYQVKKEIREMVILATQNVIQDPPFSKLDLISCRNMLIYLSSELQKKVIPRFHYALKSDGFLFLGSAESLGDMDRLFTPVNRKWKLFQRLEGRPSLQTVLNFPTLTVAEEGEIVNRVTHNKKISVRDYLEKLLLTDYSPTCVVINERGQILYVHGATGKYLQLAPGEADLNILRMANEGLRVPLSTAIRRAASQKKETVHKGVMVKTDTEAEPQIINLVVKPILKPAAMQGLLVVLFEEVPPSSKVTTFATESESNNQQVNELKQELKSTQQYLQTTVEELETSNEELKSTNEELQSSNEELQSSNEELVTAKEELQSVNEELMTVNLELENKVEELTLSNSDMTNLLASIDVGAIFLNRNLHIRRFNPAATRIFNLIEGDIGRPLGHIASKLMYDDLLLDAEKVLETLTSRQLEVQSHDKFWYWMRIRPYRTQRDVIEGVVLTYVDITAQKEREKMLQEQEAFLRTIYEGIDLAIYIIQATPEGDFRYLDVNPTHQRLTGITKETIQGKKLEELTTHLSPKIIAQARKNYQYCRETKESLKYEIQAPTRTGKMEWWMVRLQPLLNDQDQVYQIIGTATSITERKQFEQLLRDREERLRLALEAGQLRTWDWHLQPDAVFHEEGGEDIYNMSFGYTENDYQKFLDQIHPEDRERVEQAINQAIETGQPYQVEFRVVLPDGTTHWRLVQGQPYQDDETGNVVRIVAVGQDITERKMMEKALQESETRLRTILRNSHVVIFNHDKTLRYVKLYNRHPSLEGVDVLGKTDYDLFSTADADRLTKIKQKVLDTGRGITAKISLTIEGQLEAYHLVVEPWFDADNQVTGLTCASWNITRQQLLETEVTRLQKLLADKGTEDESERD